MGLDRAEVAAAASGLLGTRITDVQPVAGYVGNQDFLLTGTDGRYVLKAGDAALLAAESWACERVRAHGVPAPSILATDLAGQHLGLAVLVMEHLAGSSSPAPDNPVIAETGRQLRRVHSLAMPGFGPIRVAGDGKVAVRRCCCAVTCTRGTSSRRVPI